MVKLFIRRIVLKIIEDLIESAWYFTAADAFKNSIYIIDEEEECSIEIPKQLRQHTFCTLILKDGTSVTGSSICKCSGQEEIARSVAKQDAIFNAYKLYKNGS